MSSSIHPKRPPFDTEGIYVVIPAFCAERTVGQLIEELQSILPKRRILLVDDGSPDATGSVGKRRGVTVLSHPANRGKGAALATGVQYALDREDCRAVITVDADLQHEVGCLMKFIRLFNAGTADVIVGRRRRAPGVMPAIRILANSVTSFLLSIRSGVSIRDSQCGFRLISPPVAASIPMTYSGAQAETELLLRAALRGSRIAFVPIPTLYNGEPSYIHPIQDIADFLKIYVTSFFDFLR